MMDDETLVVVDDEGWVFAEMPQNIAIYAICLMQQQGVPVVEWLRSIADDIEAEHKEALN